jgi:AcrR family transcriptional regulator
MTTATPQTTPKASPRKRLLDAAAALFYREGVGVGVDALRKAAGVSKHSMYQLLASKDDLMAATPERQHPVLVATLVPPPAPRRAPAPACCTPSSALKRQHPRRNTAAARTPPRRSS